MTKELTEEQKTYAKKIKSVEDQEKTIKVLLQDIEFNIKHPKLEKGLHKALGKLTKVRCNMEKALEKSLMEEEKQ